MDSYLKYVCLVMFLFFSFYYTNKVFDLSKKNSVIMVNINEYAEKIDYKCKEGSINNDGVVLGLSGLMVDKNKSYSYMKGIGFKENLIQYKKDECILSTKNNIDKYIVSGNKFEKNISLVINVLSGEYYSLMSSVFESNKSDHDFLINTSYLLDSDNVLFKGKSKSELKRFMKEYDSFYCVNVEDNVLDICMDENINSINAIHVIKSDLLFYMKNNLSNGNIYFIDENNINYKELSSTLKYIKSRGYNIVNVKKLLD